MSLNPLIEPQEEEQYRYIPAESTELNDICQIYAHTLNRTYPYHWLEYYEVAIILEGNCNHAINGKFYSLQPGSLFLLTPADFHTLIINDKTPISIMGVMFDEGILDFQLRKWLFSDRNYYNFLLPERDRSVILDLFKMMNREYQEMTLGSQRLITSAIENILIYIARYNRKYPSSEIGINVLSNTNSNSMQKALLYIHHHFRQPITLEMVAGQANLSTNYFSEQFHKITGETYQRYLKNLRLRFAAGLLSTSDLPIIDILMASGFNDLSHFGRIFKQAYQLSPRQFRYHHQKERLLIKISND